MKRQIGISVASLLPWSLGKDGFRRSIDLIAKADFDGLQILPFRGWIFCDDEDEYGKKTNLDASGVSGLNSDLVISFEDAWNSGSFFGALQREAVQLITRKCIREHKPRLWDWFLFGSREQSEKAVQGFIKYFPQAIYVSNGWPKYIKREYGTELCPEMIPKSDKSTRDEIFDRISRILNSIVWDTKHILRGRRHGEPPIALTTNSSHDNWRELLEKIHVEQIKLIHVKPKFPSELELHKMLNSLAKKTQGTLCPVILEDKPVCSSQQKTIDYLKNNGNFWGSILISFSQKNLWNKKTVGCTLVADGY